MTFAQKMQGIINKGVAASGTLARSARGKAKDLGAMGMVKLEIVQMQAEAARLIAKLGSEVYATLVEKDQATVSRETPAIRALLKKIEALRTRVDTKEKEYHAIGSKKKV